MKLFHLQGQKIYNVTREKAEKLGRIYLASADELGEVTSMTEGNIAVVSGLKVQYKLLIVKTVQ